MTFNTTTHANRNLDRLEKLAEFVRKPEPINILQIGTGLSVKGFGAFTGVDSRARPIAKPIETLLRRVGLPDSCFENYETGELLKVFQEQVFGLTVLDINQRLLKIIEKQYRKNNIITMNKDLSEEQIPYNYDAIICMNVLSRLKQDSVANAVLNIVNAVKEGGYICVSSTEGSIFEEYGLINREAGIFQKK